VSLFVLCVDPHVSSLKHINRFILNMVFAVTPNFVGRISFQTLAIHTTITLCDIQFNYNFPITVHSSVSYNDKRASKKKGYG